MSDDKDKAGGAGFDTKLDEADEYVDAHVGLLGYAAVTVGDGMVLVLSTAMLKRLLALSAESPHDRVVLFIKRSDLRDMN